MSTDDKKEKELGQFRAPISEAMEAYAEDGAIAFHTPGHKQGLGAHSLLQKLITPEGLKQEVSLMEELDDLHSPNGCIMEAELLASQLWEAKDTLFMINGTTGAIHAMIMGTLGAGDKVIVPRNAHRSIIGGLILSGAIPVFVEPEINQELGIAMGITSEAVREAIAKEPKAKAVIVVYPTYYGFCSDLRKIAEVVHQAGMLLLVDEAHGAHLKFCDTLPQQALDLGADIVAQSTHKLLGSMTQTSMLHIGSDRVDRGRIRQAAALLQSTSPNQLLLASLDIARLQMAEEGAQRIKNALWLANVLRQYVNSHTGLYSPGRELCLSEGSQNLDETKVIVNVKNTVLAGWQAELVLRHDFGVQCELSDHENLLFIISMADTSAEIDYLCKVLTEFWETYGRTTEQGRDIMYMNKRVKMFLLQEQTGDVEELFASKIKGWGNIPLAKQRMSPRQAFQGKTEDLPLAEAAGRISAEAVTFYPPGVPVLCPGEEISSEIIDYILEMKEQGRSLSGTIYEDLDFIRVIVNEE